MDNEFIFAGNRAFVFDRALKLGIRFKKIFCEPNSYLLRYCEANGIEVTLISTKESLLSDLHRETFSFFVSNGLKYILPISELSQGTSKKFINIHPSLLPDLRGKHPITGALLLGRDAGATCHYMDDGIDTGSVIAQCIIPMTDDLSADLLYQLSFRAEADVFEMAYKRDFARAKEKVVCADPIYYSRRDEDLYLDPIKDDVKTFCRKVRAFNVAGQYARLKIGLETKKVGNARNIDNSYVVGFSKDSSVGAEVMKWGNGSESECALIKLKDGLVVVSYAK